ncbi:hypothetical protein IJH24_03270 [Candidatus Saccharibacteria bacterium]|nr:hypothetical protein [Candidatus Saccharibacteria bacterium]
MKVPFAFQNTEYDCCSTSFLNALNFLFDREEIPVQLIKAINHYSLDEKSENGVVGEGGTSYSAVERIAREFNKNDDLICCQVLNGKDVTLEKMRECLEDGGVVVARCYQEQEHYVLITDINDQFTYLFDPYYLEEDHYIDDDQVAMAFDEMFTYNRIVKNGRLMGGSKSDFSLMEPEKREVILIKKKGAS